MSQEVRILVVGVGNRFRSDDGAGLEAARRLRGRVPDGVEVAEVPGDGAALIARWSGADAVIVVDAVRSGARPGTVRRIDVRSRRLPVAFHGRSTHGFGLAEAVETARSLGRLPRTLVIYGIEGGRFAHGTSLCEAVSRSVNDVVSRVRADVDRILDRSRSSSGRSRERRQGQDNGAAVTE